MQIFCILPAYNEEKRIKQVVQDIKAEKIIDQIIVIDDCSTDRTYQIASQENVLVLRHIINLGQGAALRTGTNYAIAHGHDDDIIVHFDADGQMQAKDLKTIIQPLKDKKAELVLGSRFLKNKNNMPWLKKHFIMPIAKIINKLFFNIKLTDPQSGFRAMTIATAKKISWQQDKMAHCSEILILAHKKNIRIGEVPITIIYHNFGQKLSGGFKIIKDLFIAKLIN